ncbi:hypothetical protein EMIT0P171_130032 [Pseudomonas sp. IT-P171]
MLPWGDEVVVNPVVTFHLMYRVGWFWGCFAAQREQAPSPQMMGGVSKASRSHGCQ